MALKDVTIEIRDFVATIEFHRPPSNFFDAELIGRISDAIEIVDSDASCRSILLCSEGKNFCAGAMIDGDGSDPTRAPDLLYREGLRLFRGHLPIVAAIQGAAVGGGLGLALVADFRVATPESRFNCNFARLGFHHGFGLTVTLPSLVGNQRAIEMLYTGGQVKGNQAIHLGLCDRLVGRDVLRDEAFAFAREIAVSAPLAVRSIRETMRGHLVADIERATERECQAQVELLNTKDFAEGVSAMADRRTPNFSGR